MKKLLTSLLFTALLLVGCNGTTPNNTKPEGDEGEGGQGGKDYTKTEIVFGDVFKDQSADFTLAASYVIGDITLKFNKGTGTNDPVYDESDKEARIYRGNTLTILKDGMTRVDFVFSGAKTGAITVDKGTYVAGGATTGKWTGDAANDIVFTVSDGQRRTLSITVYTGDYPEDVETNYPEDNDSRYTVDVEHLGLTSSLPEAQSNFNELMMGYFGKNRNELTSLSTTGKVQLFYKSQTYNGKVYEILALQVGSANDTGSLTLNFSKELKTVKLYSSTNLSFNYDKTTGEYTPKSDTDCQITVNGEDWNLGTLSGASAEVTRQEKEFTINSNTLTLSGTANHRVFTYALTFTF